MSSRLETGFSFGTNLVFYGMRVLAGAVVLAALVQPIRLLTDGINSMTPAEFWVPIVILGVLGWVIYKASNWFRTVATDKLQKHSKQLADIEDSLASKLATIEVSIVNKVEQELAERRKASDGRRALQDRLISRPKLGVLKMTVLGGAGWEGQVKSVLHLTADENNLYFSNTQENEEISISLSDLRKVEIAGPGTSASGGGFSGGGFGVEGFILGAAAASVLNALTSRTKTETIVYLRFKESEIILLSGELGLDEMRIRLSPIFIQLKDDLPSRSIDKSFVNQLASLAELRASGALSDEEYMRAKEKVLGNS